MITRHLSVRRLLPVALFLVASMAALSAGQDGKQVVAGANNYHRLDANFASGGLTTADAFAAIKQLGFKTVVNLRAASEQNADLEGEGDVVRKAGMQYFSLPFSPATPDDAAVTKFLDLARKPENLPLYVHCAAGVRANAFWLIKRVLVDRWTPEKAMAESTALGMENARLRDYALAYIQAHPAK